MQIQSFLLAALSVTAVSAHFSVTYPYWRGNSYKTQWTYPCGGVNQSISDTNRTLWPLDGGALVFKPSHTSAQTYINIGFGNNVTSLNETLIGPFNQTGNGTFCFPHITLPEGLDITEGLNASIQVVQLSHNGGALYNCADITFSAEAVQTLDGDVCFNSTGVGSAPFEYGDAAAATTCNESTSTSDTVQTTNSTGGAAPAGSRMGTGAVMGAVGVVVAVLMM
ncbi:uncharacterized protein LAJ45_11297 [Morchella importuna]|uniref:Copper acquisition factor BIM1-like domain-containing protein n=1 Tax=Morchella conica CCBAS932 TaxID=1392247 RepID=A0A3N4KHR3_9PEZI|nr:uncharacterized protein LAJ45_11297 [Morchella importuna]KAH8144703.1 hypothetical protein LAJ45_11297 [Morchella importuna]RPB10103.1 hypothetical protein P167DRAFT_576520 [Morchella conica CCBAS932]